MQSSETAEAIVNNEYLLRSLAQLAVALAKVCLPMCDTFTRPSFAGLLVCVCGFYVCAAGILEH